MTRTCTKCKRPKTETEFHRYTNGKLRTQCAECDRVYQRKRYAEDPIKHKARTKFYRNMNPEKIREVQRKRKLAKERKEQEEARQKERRRKQEALAKQRLIDGNFFTYQDGYALTAVWMDGILKFEIADREDEVAVLVPPDRTELLYEWLKNKIGQGNVHNAVRTR